MHLFTSTVDDYCNHPISEFPAPIRAFRSLVIGVLWVFGKVMWRCDFERKELIAGQGGGTGSVIICNHTSNASAKKFAWAAAFAPSPSQSSIKTSS